jgi:integrase
LTWDRVDLEAGTVDLAWQLQQLPQVHGCKPPCGYERAGWCPERRFDTPTGFALEPLRGSLALTRPKSRAGRRLVPLPVPLAALLLKHQQDTTANPYGLVWTESGHPVAPRRDYTAWKAALDRAGLPDVPLHAARHTTATLLLEHGVDQHVIASIMGHSSVIATRGYLHSGLVLQRAAMSGLDKLLAIE